MHCPYCEWRCDLEAGRLGVCRMYLVEHDRVVERFPHRWSTVGVSRVESLPFYHAYPGSRCLTIGTFGCNLLCRYCLNGFVARRDPDDLVDQMMDLGVEEVVSQARKMGCHSIVFNVNEPVVSLPTLVELGRAARAAGLAMGCLTNAYSTEEATEQLTSVFDFFNIGLKGFAPAFHREYIGIPSVEPVLRNIRRLARDCHVEVTTPVIQAVNEDDLDDIAAFLAEVDPNIPWHVFRLLPEHEMQDADYPGIEDISRRLAGFREKLPYVYFHNFVGSDWVNTACPHCGTEVIQRFSLGCGGDRLQRFDCRGRQCPACGYEIRMLGTHVPWHTREEGMS